MRGGASAIEPHRHSGSILNHLSQRIARSCMCAWGYGAAPHVQLSSRNMPGVIMDRVASAPVRASKTSQAGNAASLRSPIRWLAPCGRVPDNSQAVAHAMKNWLLDMSMQVILGAFGKPVIAMKAIATYQIRH